ncbi:MAG TPA: GAF domain-containing protein, partial [Anaerolineales bacterium]|nr:GAF domain-containing protein [Anaerolineales bacterium]
GPKRNEATGTDNAQLGMSQRQEHDDRNLTEERYSLLEGILQSTSDGILAVDRDNQILFANERFAQLWRIPQEVMDTRDDAHLLQFVMYQLSDPVGFLRKVQELYESTEESFETLYFKDGRVFDRLSRPLFQGTKLAGRVWSFRDTTERRQVEVELHRRADEFAALYDTARDLAAQHNLPALLHTIAERARTLLQAAGGGIYLYDPMQGDLEMVLALGISVPVGARLQKGEGMAGRVAQTRQPLIVDDYHTWEGRSLQYEAMPFRAVLQVPMLYGGELIGVLAVNEIGRTERKFNEADASLLSLFAEYAASAVQAARLLQSTRRRVEELSALQSTALEITAPHELANLLHTIVKRAAQLLNADAGGLYLCNSERQEARCVVSYNTPQDYTGVILKYGEGAAGLVAQTGKPLIVDDYRTWAGRAGIFSDQKPFERLVSAPMLWHDQVIGVIHVLRPEGGTPFTQADLELLSLLANHAAIAVANAQQFEHLQLELTERRRMEDALRESEHQMRALVTSLDDIVIEYDEQGTYLNVWTANESLLAQPKIQMLGRRLDEVLGEEKGSQLTEAVKRVLTSGHSEVIEYPLQVIGGQRWFMAQINPIIAQDASQRTASMLIRDITEQKRAEEALRESQARLAGMINTAMDAIISVDANQNIILFNPAAAQMLRCPAAEAIGQPLDRFIPARFRQAHGSHIRKFGETNQTHRSIGGLSALICLRADGTEFPAEIAISQIEMAGQRIYTAILRDITERKQAEEKIQQQLRRLNALRDIDIAISSTFDMKTSLAVLLNKVTSQLGVDAAAVLLFNGLTHELRYIAVNGFNFPSIEQTRLRLGEGLLAGRAAFERRAVHITDLAQMGEHFGHSSRLVEEGFVTYHAMPLIAKGELKGVLEVFHRAKLHTDSEWLEFLEALTGQAAIAIDNAQLFENLQRSKTELEHRVAERTAELQRMNIELERANHAKDEFLANMSHELRTPLNSILGMSESLLEQKRDPLSEDQQRFLETIDSSGRHLLELINDVLDLSKIEAGKFDVYPQVMEVNPLCQSCLAFVRAQALKKSISLVYEEADPAFKIYADPRRLKQILVNLLTNAVKFTPEHGRVTLHVHADMEQDLVQFSVIDTGIGIDLEDVKHLFQSFVQVDSSLNRQFEGTGLGLALVQKLTDLHGGSVSVESEVDRGSHFTINLPWRRQLVAQLETAEPGEENQAQGEIERTNLPPVVPQSHPRLLLAEDNAANVLTIGEYLESHGYTVQVAHDGLEALQMAEETEPDIILMDIQMPALDGLEAIRRLRANPRFASTPIIAITALAMPGDRERCLEAGADEYLSKPVSLKTLLKTIKYLLQQE